MESDNLVDSYQEKCSGIAFTADPPELEAHAVDGVAPSLILKPESDAEVSAILSWANDQRVPVVPQGGGTSMALGSPFAQTQEFICLSLKGLNEIAEYDADNLTVTVQCGVTIQEVQRRVAEKREFLPLDPPGLKSATAGGVLATNASGPRRFGYGSARDFVLGLRVVTPDGRLIKCGGKSVKNVAGYDMSKLFIGSLGTLGVIVEATFRLVPLPTTTRTVLLQPGSREAAAETVAQLLASHLLPSAIELLDAGAVACLPPECGVAPTDSYVVAVLFEGFQDAVERQARQVARREGAKGVTLPAGKDEAFWAGVRGLLVNGAGNTRCKISVPIASTVEMASAAGELHATSVSHAGNGIVYTMFAPDAKRPERSIARLRQLAESKGGHLVVESAPAEVKEKVDIWGSSGSAEPVMRKLREAYDPNAILNPGRFVV